MLASVVFHCLAVLVGILTGFGETSVKVTQLPESTSRNTGTNVSFHCTLPFFQDGPRVNIYWWKEGANQYLSTEQDDRKVIGFKTKFSGFLQISNVSVEDAGIYYCTVAHRDKIVGNGTGSNLVVWVPPTPLRIKSQQDQKDSFASLVVLCVTSPFYPKNISFTWYKDGRKIASRINNIIELKTDGLYEASSRLQEAQSVRTGTVYTCSVSHSTLHISATATHIVTYTNTDGELTRCLLISSAAWGGLVLLLLGLLIAKRCISKKNKDQPQVTG
ncbi:tyrosine-protein phosphatase non-receptor type substrate 1-like isoform X2 [Heterodontus francisci]|uniref:tyrosine-protein phosphatase non-receptor type substrate 1-like isoform X2 n=1 Tax=Heterodontus francisci TaxID=7792 RepID=UPI00355C0AD4